MVPWKNGRGVVRDTFKAEAENEHEALPRNANGKLQKQILRDRLAEQLPVYK